MSLLFSKELMSSNMETLTSLFKLNEDWGRSLGAFICAVQGKKADPEKLKECKEIMKSEHKAFSDFRGLMELPLIVKMSISDDPRAYLLGVTDVYKKLSANYKVGNESRLLAAVILYDNIKAEELETVCQKIMDIFGKVKSSHPVLGGQNLLPMLALMVLKGEDTDKMLTDMEECYNTLNRKFKLSKDAVLTVSNILALESGTPAGKCDKFMTMFEAFDRKKVSIKGSRMPILAVLVNLGLDPEDAVSQSIRNDEDLKSIKGFSGVLGIDSQTRHTYAAAITAVNKAQGDSTTESAIMSTVLSIVISIEMMIMLLLVYDTVYVP